MTSLFLLLGSRFDPRPAFARSSVRCVVTCAQSSSDSRRPRVHDDVERILGSFGLHRLVPTLAFIARQTTRHYRVSGSTLRRHFADRYIKISRSSLTSDQLKSIIELFMNLNQGVENSNSITSRQLFNKAISSARFWEMPNLRSKFKLYAILAGTYLDSI